MGDLVRRRLGDEVLDRLVAPLVGSVYGDCDRLSLQVTAAQLAGLRRPVRPHLVRGPPRPSGPRGSTPASPCSWPPEAVWAGWPTLADSLGDDVRTGTTVTGLTPDGTRWRVSAGGSDDAARNLAADAVVLATPAFVSAPLLAPVAPGPAALLGRHRPRLGGAARPGGAPRRIDHPMDGSGFPGPPQRRAWCSRPARGRPPWQYLAVDPFMALLRASAGHDGDDRSLALPDHELVAAMLANRARRWACGPTPWTCASPAGRGPFPSPAPATWASGGRRGGPRAVSPRPAITGAWARGGHPRLHPGAPGGGGARPGGTNGR